MMRAKFKCVKKAQLEQDGYELEFEPVVGGSPENDEFFKYTPWGELKLGTVNAEAADQFEPGKEYYLNLTEV